MKNLKITLCFLLILVSSYSVYGQILELDLASISPGEIKVISENKNLSYTSVLLLNTVPVRDYTVRYEIEKRLLDPLPVEAFRSENDVDLCEDLVLKLAGVKEDKNLTEEGVKGRIEDIELKIKQCEEAVKSDANINNEQKVTYNNLIEDAKSSLDTLFRKEAPLDIKVATGEIVKIYVSRDDLVWTFVLKGRQPGKWVTTYGFGFTSSALEGSTYYTKQIPDTTVFEILKSRKPDVIDLNYVPAVFFSYFPSQKFNSGWNHSLTAGLGFDLSAPVVFFGYNGLFYNNIGLSTGIAFQQQHRLKSQYSENEIISITLEKDQLHDKIYRPNFFISINFRFGKNPFKSKNESDNE